jgi:hypothetical protein
VVVVVVVVVIYYMKYRVYNNIHDVPSVKVTNSGLNSKADSESKSHIHMVTIGSSSGFMSFQSTVNKLERICIY